MGLTWNEGNNRGTGHDRQWSIMHEQTRNTDANFTGGLMRQE